MIYCRPSLVVRVIIHGVVYFGALLMLAPFLWMICTSLKTNVESIDTARFSILPDGSPASWQWRNYVEAWETANLGGVYANSLIVALIVTIVSVAHNALAGFAFAKLRMRGGRAVFAATIATMLLPYQVYFIFVYVLCGWFDYLDSLHALIVPFLAGAFGIFYMRQTIITVSDNLLDAGRIDGLTDFQLFVHIVAPTVRPAFAALAIFTFMASWNNFFWPLIVIDSQENFTLPLAVAGLSSGLYVESWPVQMAAATLITLPTIIVFLVFHRSFINGLSLTGSKG